MVAEGKINEKQVTPCFRRIMQMICYQKLFEIQSPLRQVLPATTKPESYLQQVGLSEIQYLNIAPEQSEMLFSATPKNFPPSEEMPRWSFRWLLPSTQCLRLFGAFHSSRSTPELGNVSVQMTMSGHVELKLGYFFLWLAQIREGCLVFFRWASSSILPFLPFSLLPFNDIQKYKLILMSPTCPRIRMRPTSFAETLFPSSAALNILLEWCWWRSFLAPS